MPRYTQRACPSMLTLSHRDISGLKLSHDWPPAVRLTIKPTMMTNRPNRAREPRPSPMRGCPLSQPCTKSIRASSNADEPALTAMSHSTIYTDGSQRDNAQESGPTRLLYAAVRLISYRPGRASSSAADIARRAPCGAVLRVLPRDISHAAVSAVSGHAGRRIG